MTNFLDELVKQSGVSDEHPIVQYLYTKTKAVDRDSKARRSLGNLYALHVVCADYANGKHDGSRFTDLLKRMKAMPFGSKLQNHPLDNRLNDEFKRKFNLPNNLLPIQAGDGTAKVRKISSDLLALNNSNPTTVASLVVTCINTYVEQITENQNEFLRLAEEIDSADKFISYVKYALAPSTDARVLEIVSYAILKNVYSKQIVEIKSQGKDLIRQTLTLFKTGRTNANDGGIDFVLKPLGRFFQVTEVIDFDKFFLDFEKVNRFPISFVVKTDQTEKMVKEILFNTAKNKWGKEDIAQRYIDLVEEVINTPMLLDYARSISNSTNDMSDVKSEIIIQFKLEYGILD